MGLCDFLFGPQCGQGVVSFDFSGVFTLLCFQLSAPPGLGAGSCVIGSDQFWAEPQTRNDLLWSTSAFVCPESTRQVNWSRKVGLTSALMSVWAPGGWLSALSRALVFF